MKTEWAESLKPGDFVEDCRLKVLRITEVQKEYTWPNWFHDLTIIFPLWIPHYVDDAWVDFLYKVAPYIASRNNFADARLVLEDGQYCSAMHCCDPPPEGFVYE